MKQKKPNTKNLTIPTRVALAAVAGLVLAIMMIAIFSTAFRFAFPSYYNFSTVTTNNYSVLNQLQWAQTMDGITNELLSDLPDKEKKDNLEDTARAFSNFNTLIYIERNNEEFFSNAHKNKVMREANAIVKIKDENSIYYYGENGLVIVSHAEKEGEEYCITITNPSYTVNDISLVHSPQDISSLIFSKFGLVIIFIIVIMMLSILLVSFITSKTITKPIKMLSDGANEIANGNLDYIIEYDSTNEIGSTVKSMNDMTLQLKQSIENRKNLEESRKQMTAGLAHDLRTPLTSVKGYVEGLRDGIANTPEKQEQYLQTIYSSTLAMEKLLDELQTISRLERGKIQLEKQNINIDDFIKEFIEENIFKLEKYNFSLEYHPSKDNEELIIPLDPDRFSRVLTNIFSNSIKYASKARAGKIDITVENYDKYIILTISDNGIGISNENIAHIFDSFFRADQARTRTSEGSGLGLSVCKELIELHGGQIWATSAEGEGTNIMISLNKATEDDNE